jgi:hypothetical protein
MKNVPIIGKLLFQKDQALVGTALVLDGDQVPSHLVLFDVDHLDPAHGNLFALDDDHRAPEIVMVSLVLIFHTGIMWTVPVIGKPLFRFCKDQALVGATLVLYSHPFAAVVIELEVDHLDPSQGNVLPFDADHRSPEIVIVFLALIFHKPL